MKRKNVSSLVSIFLFFLTTASVFAGTEQDRLINIVKKVADLLGGLFLIGSTAMFLYAGFVYWQAGGKTEDVNKAHKNLLWAIIGTAVGLLAYVFPKIIENFIGSS